MIRYPLRKIGPMLILPLAAYYPPVPDFVIHSGGLHKYQDREILQQELVLRISTRSDRIYFISQSQTMSVTQKQARSRTRFVSEGY
jgi:hypothetical protein